MRSRYLLCALVLIGLQSFAEAAPINLLTNPSNEAPLVGGEIPGWTEVTGTLWKQRSTNPSAVEGSFYFFADDGASAELAQVVDVSAWAMAIDRGQQVFKFQGYVRVFNQTPPDASRIVVEYRNANDGVIDQFDSGNIFNKTNWQLVPHTRNAPVGTRSINVRLISTRHNGTNNDGYYDALSLTMEGLIEYVGQTNCATLDSGFDATTATPNPPWLSVAVGQTTRVAKAEIAQGIPPRDVEFESTIPARVTVSPATARISPQPLSVQGITAGDDARINALVDQTDVESLNVAAYNVLTVTVSVHLIQMKKASGDLCPRPTVSVTKASLQTGINRIWDQAAVRFTVLRVNNFFDGKAIQADDDNDCIADEKEPPPGPTDPVTFGPELQKIHAAAQDPNADVNIYFVEQYQVPIAVYHSGPSAIFIGAIPIGDTVVQVTAHELGHYLLDPALGIGYHRNDPDALMQQGGPATLCLLNKTEWDAAQP